MGDAKIVTEFVYPPIPVRCCDWAAYLDGDEEGPRAFGATREEAVQSLMDELEVAS